MRAEGTSQDPNDLRWDLADGFEFDWDSAELSARVLKGGTANTGVHTLTIDMRVGILDAEGLATVDANRPEVLAVCDGNGYSVESLRDAVFARQYEERGWVWDSNGACPPRHWCLGKLILQLPSDVNHDTPSSISRLVGCIHAIYGDVIQVDVPFDGSLAEWIEFEAVPDLAFLVDPTTPPVPGPIEYESEVRFSPLRPRAPIALYKFKTRVKSQSGRPVMAVRDEYPSYPRDVYPLGDYAIVRTELLDSQRQVVVCLPTGWYGVFSDPTGHSAGGARCWGQTEQDGNAYDRIRHVIVVHPVEVKIPFVLTNIPVPCVQGGCPTGS